MEKKNPDEERARKAAARKKKNEEATERRLQKLKADADKARKKGKPLTPEEKLRRALKGYKDE